MKKLLLLLLASSIVFVSCKQSSRNTLLIPAQSTVIAVFNVPSLIKKAQLESIDALKNENLLNDSPILREFVKNPENTGVDFSADLFVFYVRHNKNDYVCANIALKNQKQTQEFIETKFDKTFEPVGKQRFYSETYHSWVIVKNNTMLVVSSEDCDKKTSATFVDYLVNLPQSESIADDEHFKTFCKNKNDIGIFVSSTPFLQSFDADFSELLTLYYKDLNEADLYNNYVVVDVNFNEQEVEINYSFVLNEQLEQYLQANNCSKEHFSGELLQFAHATSMLAAYYSFDTDKTLAYLQNMPEFSKLAEGFEDDLGFSIDEILSVFAGDFLVSLYDMLERDIDDEVPLFVTVATVKDEETANALLQQKFADFAVKAEMNYYDFSKNGSFPLFAAVHHNTLMVTSDKNALAALAAGGFKNTLNNDFAASTDEVAGIFLNLDFSSYPEYAKMLAESILGGDVIATMPFKSLTMSGENSSMTAKMVLTMKTGDDNSLAQILRFVTGL